MIAIIKDYLLASLVSFLFATVKKLFYFKGSAYADKYKNY